jgi:hypothetical protein
MNKEKIEHHITALEKKLEALKKEVDAAYIDNVSDLELEKLKKKKLKLKDEIEACKQTMKSL